MVTGPGPRKAVERDVGGVELASGENGEALLEAAEEDKSPLLWPLLLGKSITLGPVAGSAVVDWGDSKSPRASDGGMPDKVKRERMEEG